MNDRVMFSGFGVTIIDRGGRLFAHYEVGEIAVQFREDEISQQEATEMQRSAKDAYEVILACQRRSS